MASRVRSQRAIEDHGARFVLGDGDPAGEVAVPIEFEGGELGDGGWHAEHQGGAEGRAALA
jgi:hypothetical protein